MESFTRIGGNSGSLPTSSAHTSASWIVYGGSVGAGVVVGAWVVSGTAVPEPELMHPENIDINKTNRRATASLFMVIRMFQNYIKLIPNL
ncbi:MAG TPA: hypothetical protein PLC12_06485 [Candidatus Methanofastidiosa archaeon]|nr:hypothetical protein [Candidatus Methanofastidiosa archaeon]